MTVMEFRNEPLDTPTSRSAVPKFDVLSLRACIHIPMWVRESGSKQQSWRLLGEETAKQAETWSDVCAARVDLNEFARRLISQILRQPDRENPTASAATKLVIRERRTIMRKLISVLFVLVRKNSR